MAGWRAVGRADEALCVEREKFQHGRGTGNDLLIAEEAVLAAGTQYAAAIGESQIAAMDFDSRPANLRPHGMNRCKGCSFEIGDERPSRLV